MNGGTHGHKDIVGMFDVCDGCYDKILYIGLYVIVGD